MFESIKKNNQTEETLPAGEMTDSSRVARLEYKYPEGVTPEIVAEMAANRSRSYEPTGSWHEDGREQHLAVFTTTPPEHLLKGNEVVVRFMPWSDEGDRPEGALYDALIAASTGRSVITVNSPGVNSPKWIDEAYKDLHKLTPEQHDDLKTGLTRKVGGAGLRAAFFAEAALLRKDGEEPASAVLLGSSMGGSLVAGAVGSAVEQGIDDRIHSVTIEEATNMEARPPYRDLGLNFLTMGSNAKEYLDGNPEQANEIGEDMLHWIGRVIKSRQANLAYFNALAKGGFSESLGDLSGFDAPIFIVNGSESKLSPSEWNDRVATELEEDGVDVRRIEFEGDDHPRTMNLQSTIDLVNNALEQ